MGAEPPPVGTEDASGTPDEWTADERRAFRLAVHARRERLARVGRLFAIVLIAVVGAAIVFRAPESWWVPAVGALALLALAFRLVNWKCPNCGERLPTRGSWSRCPGCGAPLE